MRLDRVSRHFGGLKAVDEVTLAVENGARHAVIGPNGAGKTTLFNVISGDLPATTGSITFSGHDVTRLPPHTRASHGMSRTFQITKLFLDLSVLENAMLACIAAGNRRFTMLKRLTACRDLGEKAAALLEDFDLDGVRHEHVRHVSYGDQRRLEVALALAGRPRLLLLDEPMAGLSSPERAVMRNLLAALDPTLAVMLIEHDMDVAFSFADRITVLHQGKVLADGSRDDVSGNDLVQQAYLAGSRH